MGWSVEEARKNAFRRVLYAAMLDFRGHSPVGPQTQSLWLNPWLVGPTFRRLREIQETADWLHNLALFASLDFEHFDEDWFWKETSSLFRRFPSIERRLGVLRHYFEYDWIDSADARRRTWGQKGES